jgi:hypothetical protein
MQCAVVPYLLAYRYNRLEIDEKFGFLWSDKLPPLLIEFRLGSLLEQVRNDIGVEQECPHSDLEVILLTPPYIDVFKIVVKLVLRPAP